MLNMKFNFNFIFISAAPSLEPARLPRRVARIAAALLLIPILPLSSFAGEEAVQSSPAVTLADQHPAESQTTPAFLPHPDSRFWVSGQTNIIFQAHPPFPARYSGPNSLSARYEKATSRVMTLFLGFKLNNSTEVLVNVEAAGGDGLSHALGVAGFTNLDVVRNPSLGQKPYLARLEVHRIFAFGAQKATADRGPFSGFVSLPERRLEVRAGRLSLADFFDLNTEGTDSHFQFMNWATDNNAAYDYAADTRGYTYAAILDYETPRWGLRFAEALLPTVANGIDLNWNLRHSHSENYEWSLKRFVLRKQRGAVRLLAFHNTANMGIYRVAIDQYLAGIDPIPSITAHPQQETSKYGFGINVEQAITPGISVFGRFGWNNGKTESYVYTEADQTFLVGAGFYGQRWKRAHDKAGIAFVSSAISGNHRRYLELGGTGFLLGDGSLTYGREKIVEAYYTAHLWRGVYLGPDLQRIDNPGYNQSRGPVLVPGFRTHFEF